MRRIVLLVFFLCVSAASRAAAPPDASSQASIADIVARVSPSVVRIIVVHPPARPEPASTVVAKAKGPGGTASSGTGPSGTASSGTAPSGTGPNGTAKSAPTDMADLTPDVHVGSGFAVAPGLIATNRHVIEGAVLVYVSTLDGARYPADIVGTAIKADIALIRIDKNAGLKPLAFGDSDKVRQGDVVIAIGSPFGFDNSVTAGVVSSVNRDIMESPFDDYIQSDAAINHGNSGGPLFNMAGEVVGMNSVLFAPTQGFSGLGFAIPSNDLRFVLDRLEKYGETRGGMLPIRTQQVTGLMAEALGLPQAGGALVASVSDEANQMKGQIQAGDVISGIGGKPVSDPRDLARKAAVLPVDSRVMLTLWRGGTEMSVEVPVFPIEGSRDARKAMAAPRLLGLHFAPSTPTAPGARLAAIDPTGTAADAGLMKGDVVLQVQQTQVASGDQVMRAIQQRIEAKRRFTALLVLRDGKPTWFPIALPD